MKIGSANYDNKAKKRNYFSLEEGENVYRILPPLGNLADKGKIAVYYSVHWGYKNEEGRNRLFVSPEIINRNNKMVEVEDAAKERIKALRAKQEEFKQKGDMEAVKRLSTVLRQYNLENKWHLNVMTLDGRIGLLKIPHKAKMALDAEIKSLVAKGVDPTSVDAGRFFVFKRVGTGSETSHSVSVYKEKINVEGVGEVERAVTSRLSEDVLSRLSSEAFELDSLYNRPSATAVRQIVEADARGDRSLIDSLLNLGSKQGRADSEGPSEDEVEAEQAVAAPAAPVAPAQSVAPTVGTAAVAAAPTVNAEAMSDEEFLKSLGM
jgi:hypothetical protein